MTVKKCLFCGGKADLLCDSWLGWERKRGELQAEAPNLLTTPSWGVPIRYRHVHTCDAPLCRACAVPAGSFVVRLRHRGTFYETVDYCPGHGGRNGGGDRRTEITGLQAEAMRATWRAQAARQRNPLSVAQQLELI